MKAMDKEPYTLIRIESFDGKNRYMSQIQENSCDMNGNDLVQLFKQCMMGAGYHFETIAEVFNEEKS